MKTENLVLLGLGAVVVFYVANLGLAGSVLQCYIKSVDFTGLTTGQIVLMVQNPSNATIQLNSMAGTVSANGSVIGNISNFQGGISIPSNQQTPVTITVSIALTGIVSTLYTALTSPSGLNTINFVINANANINTGIIVPLNITQSVNV